MGDPVWLATVGQGWAEQTLGLTTNMPVTVLAWVLSFAAGLGIIAGSVFLMPAVTALVASFFVDDIAPRWSAATMPLIRQGLPSCRSGRALMRRHQDRALLAVAGLPRGAFRSCCSPASAP